MRAVKKQTIQQCSVAAELLVLANVSTDSVLKEEGGMTHLGMKMTNQVQQLLHTLLKGRCVTPRVYAQCQRVCVQFGKVAKHLNVFRDLLDSDRLFVLLRIGLSPAVK